MVEGWILDLYPFRSGEMVIWIKSKDGKCTRLVDSWRPSIYVASDDVSDLEYLRERKEIQSFIHQSSFERKIEKIADFEPSNVLRLKLKDAKHIERLAEQIERLVAWGVYRIYNVDVMPAQSYCCEKNLFPLAYVRAEVNNSKVYWELLDDVKREDYELPPLRSVALKVRIATKSKIPNHNDPIDNILLSHCGCETKISVGSESEKILGLVKTISQLDPDIIFTDGGDQFVIPYLIQRAQVNRISNEFILGREKSPLLLAPNEGRSYFSYGRVLYKHPTYRFLGRIHIDESNTSFYDQCRLEGLFEVARLSRIPLHTAVRASIGKALGGIQFYTASKDDILIPWKPSLAEHPKTARNLLIADRGGFIFEPRVGVYSGVGELDFASLYPTIMVSKNISAETIQCECCPDSSNHVPEVDYNICEKRRGIIPRSLELVLKKRLKYKKLRDLATDPEVKARYDSRQAALKWILVCCFGYLGYRNAKFGRIDAHISVCAFARKILLDAVRIAERRGFKVIHGIIDSLWLRKPNTSAEDYVELCQEIESVTGFQISFEGLYKWIVFLSSRMYDDVPVMNRYFGAFEDGEVKVRGIESRRRDTPKIVSRCQDEMLGVLGEASNVEDVLVRIPRALDVLKRYRDRLRSQQVPLEDLIITKGLSKNPDEYKVDIVQALAAQQLVEEGLRLSAGQKIRYVLTDYKGRGFRRRAVAAQLAESDTKYDVEKYLDLLVRGAASILTPFGFDEEKIGNSIRNDGAQSNLEELFSPTS